MTDIDSIDSQAQSVTATVCENAQLYGATPERGEFDPREVWDRRRRHLRSQRSVPHPRRRASGRTGSRWPTNARASSGGS